MRIKFISKLFDSSLFIFIYLTVAVFSLCLSYCFRFDFDIPEFYKIQLLTVVCWVVFIQCGLLFLFGESNVIIRFFGLSDLRSIFSANVLACLLVFIISIASGIRIPRGIIVVDFILITGFIYALRVGLRLWYEFRHEPKAERDIHERKRKSVAVVGAGDAAARVVRELLAKPALPWVPVAVFDDNPLNWGKRLHGLKIIGKPECMLNSPWRENLKRIIVADSGLSAMRLRDIARISVELEITYDTLPPFDQILSGTVKLSQVRPVRIDDLLRRPIVLINRSSIHAGHHSKVVAITGAGGSIGSELCRQILKENPRMILLIERSEVQLFQIEQELLRMGAANIIVPLVADVVDTLKVRDIFMRYRPEVVYHAAAHKHVPLMEAQPAEAIRNNFIGTSNLIRIVHEFGVERFVLISTDKAVNPTNVMGASKRLAEIFLQSYQIAHPDSTRFMAVRFGNVLGSSGSVVLTFNQQIASGGPVTVTHPDVTRFFMTIPEAVCLVLQAGILGQGGEIFVLDMGEPVKIVDLARQMIELSGYIPEKDIEIQFVGLRPGEKMYEEISHNSEQLTSTVHPKIFRFVSDSPDLGRIEIFLNRFINCPYPMDNHKIKSMIRELVPDYRPFNDLDSI